MSSASQWHAIDRMIYANAFLEAVKLYRESNDANLITAMEAIRERRQELLLSFPETFDNEVQCRVEAAIRLEAHQSTIYSDIIAIEGIKDGDDWSGYVQLYALTEAPSSQNPKYVRHLLSDIVCIGLTTDQALAIGEELARTMQVPFYSAQFSYGDYISGDYGEMFDSQGEIDSWLSS